MAMMVGRHEPRGDALSSNSDLSKRRIAAGDHCPVFACADSDGGRFEFQSHIYGKPTVMIFLGDRSIADVQPALAGLDAETAQVLALSVRPVDDIRAQKTAAGWTYQTLFDEGGEITRAFAQLSGIEAPAVYVLDPNQRIAGIAPLGDGAAAWASGVVGTVAFPAEGATVRRMAPVLLIPRVLEPEACDWLIGLWADGQKRTGEVSLGESKGNVSAVVKNLKRREDYVIQDTETQNKVMQLMFPRLIPEVEKIFYYRGWGIEAFRVGCYHAEDAGFFGVHRDNKNPSTRNRRYALTVNLNTGDYEGGKLRFPEYGPELFEPPRGGAVLFSCSMLHEVVPVTSGRRFTLLSFLVDRSGAQ